MKIYFLYEPNDTFDCDRMMVPKSFVLSAASPDAPIMSQVVASQGQKQSDDGDGSWGFGWGREMGWITKGFSLDERERKEI